MDDFIQRQGPAYLAHILRRLADELVRGAAEWYPEAGVSAPPRTTSTLLALEEHGPLGLTELAVLLRQSHPLVIDWRRQLLELGLVESQSDPEDGRRAILSLTPAGRREVRRLRLASAMILKASPNLYRCSSRQHHALATSRSPRRAVTATMEPLEIYSSGFFRSQGS